MTLVYVSIGFVIAILVWFTLIWMVISTRKILRGEIRNFIDWILISFIFIFFKIILNCLIYIALEYDFFNKIYRNLFLKLEIATWIIIILCFFKAVYELTKFADVYGFGAKK